MKTLGGLAVDFPTLGYDAADWIETYCVRGPGPVQGQAVELTDDDVRFLCWAYMLYPRGHELAGQRVVTDADLSKPKGWAKSELAGFISLFEAFGACRFSHWDNQGEPVGRVITYPFVRCLATEENQTGNTYRNVLYVLEHSEAMAARYRYDAGRSRTFIEEPGGGEIRPSTSGAASKDGGLETFVVADETHLYVLPEHKEMYDTVQRNGRKRRIDQPWILRTTTAFSPGEESIAEDQWMVFESVDCDVLRAIEELGLLVDHSEAPEDFDIKDDEALRVALETVYGDKAHIVDIRNMIRVDFRRPGADIAHARRYFLNQRVKAAGKWIEPALYDKRRSPLKLQRGDQIALGFDGSRTRDATGFVGCRLTDGLLQKLGYWERPATLKRWQEWEVPDEEVHQVLEELMTYFDVVMLYADPHWWRQEVDAWHGRWPDKVVKFDTSKHGRMVYAVDRMETDIGTGAVQFTADPTLRRHFLNAYGVATKIKLEGTTPPRFGRVIAKENRDSRDLIDLAAAAVLADEARGDAIAKGALKPKRSKRLRTFAG